MQVNLNCNCPKPQFGMAIHTNNRVNEVIKKRINNDINKLHKLEDIFEKASKNKTVDINLMLNPDGNTLSANIYTLNEKAGFFKQQSENFFTRHFGGGIVGFIEKCSKIADEAEPKVLKEVEIAEAFENSKLFNS